MRQIVTTRLTDRQIYAILRTVVGPLIVIPTERLIEFRQFARFVETAVLGKQAEKGPTEVGPTSRTE